MLFFFFSSRRRHTRCSRDWSSDVCSSDLLARRGSVGSPRTSWRSTSSSSHEAPERGRNLGRSEEHTSELQSRLHLVCRLLLEKKKEQHYDPSIAAYDQLHAIHDLSFETTV